MYSLFVSSQEGIELNGHLAAERLAVMRRRAVCVDHMAICNKSVRLQFVHSTDKSTEIHTTLARNGRASKHTYAGCARMIDDSVMKNDVSMTFDNEKMCVKFMVPLRVVMEWR